jgi:hypothetical protein
MDGMESKELDQLDHSNGRLDHGNGNGNDSVPVVTMADLIMAGDQSG